MKRALLIASFSASIGAVLSGGCVKQEYSQQGRVNQDPLVIDEAMQLRNWDKSYSIYQNGGTKNWSTGFGYVGRGDTPQGLNYISDVGIFALNVVTLPYTAYEERHGVESSGVNVPETYTAVPPVPPRYTETAYGPGQAPSPAAGSDRNVPINAMNNPDAENGNQINPTFPNNPARTNGGNSLNGANSPSGTGNLNGAAGNGAAGNGAAGNSNSAGNAAANDSSSGGANGSGGSMGGNSAGSATGSGAGNASGSGKAGK